MRTAGQQHAAVKAWLAGAPSLFWAAGVAEKTASQVSPFRELYPQAGILLRGYRLGAQTESRGDAEPGRGLLGGRVSSSDFILHRVRQAVGKSPFIEWRGTSAAGAYRRRVRMAHSFCAWLRGRRFGSGRLRPSASSRVNGTGRPEKSLARQGCSVGRPPRPRGCRQLGGCLD